ncbi:MAG: DnaD domain protein [Lachnospiraceae bacterium]|nr:DnaD domain protein [Lachnospiraceae bacterium]
MSDIMLHTSTSRQVTCVSNTFIDNFMKDANGEYVKIYLYMLRCLSQEGMDFSISAMADKLDHTQRDIKRALEYWERQNLLRLEYDDSGELIGICLLDPYSMPAPKPAERVDAPSPVLSTFSMVAQLPSEPKETPKPQDYSMDQIAVFKEQADVSEMIRVTEMLLGKPLLSTETQTLIYWYDQLHMSAELIEYMVEFCANKNHSSFHYMNKVAMNWAEEGITTVSQAKGENELRSEHTRAIMKAFGISGRNLTTGEMEFVKRWEFDYHFSLPIIEEALKRTILSIQKPSFEYAETILKKWSAAKVSSMEDIQKLDALFDANKRKKANTTRNITTASNNRPNRFHNFDERDYDYDALEAKLLQKRR